MRNYPTLYLDTNSSEGTYLLTDARHFTDTDNEHSPCPNMSAKRPIACS